LSPIYRSEIIDDKSTRELIRLGITISTPRQTIGDVELTDGEMDTYVMTSGQIAKQRIDDFTSGSGYDKLPDFVKEETIRRIYSKARERAKVDLGIPEKAARARAEKIRARK